MEKKRPVSLLEAYEYTHTQETTESLGNGRNKGSGDGTDEAVRSGTREYITLRSKRVADAVEAAMEDEHGPDASQHLPNDFDLWEKAIGGRKKEHMRQWELEANAREEAREREWQQKMDDIDKFELYFLSLFPTEFQQIRVSDQESQTYLFHHRSIGNDQY
nr:hypothetical protein [Tanacetum cinerariifolium]